MPWDIQDTMSLREEFVCLAGQEGANRRELCRRFGISPQTAYKWLARYANEGKAGLLDRSRRPQCSPVANTRRSASNGGRFAPRTSGLGWAQDQSAPARPGTSHRGPEYGQQHLAPARADRPPAAEDKAWQRFEHEFPNALWQADFKGHFETLQGRCSPLTVLDDHSRYNLVLQACAATPGRDRPRASGSRFPPLWSAGPHEFRQRGAVGIAEPTRASN
jgi:hypothetical protein